MPIVADFTVIEDNAVTLNSGNPTHSYPAFSATGLSAGAQAVLTWRVLPSNPPVTLEFVLNGISIQTTTFQSTQQRTYHEVIGGNVVQSGNNILTIVRSGSGEVTVSDVYLSFQAVV